MESTELIPKPRMSGALSAFYILLMLFMGFVVIGPIIGLLFAIPLYEGSVLQMIDDLQNASAHPELKLPLMVMQGIAASIGLILIPLLYIKIFFKENPLNYFKIIPQHQRALLLTFVLVITFMVVNSVFIEWNAHLKFPAFLKDFEAWARLRENTAEELTKMLTSFDTPWEFLLGFVVIAIVPAVGEELVFRGMIQKELHRGTGNIHLAIWLSAILFSAIHMQFFGFVPRMFLGALFGYLYAWSGNLWLPIVAHFVNNGFTITMLYFHQLGHFDFDIESTEAPPWYFALGFAVITFAILKYLKNFFESEPGLKHG